MIDKKRLTAKDFDQKILELYDYYAHGKITKREFLKNIGKYTAVGVTAMSVFDSLSPNYAFAEQVSFNDPEIKANNITYDSPNGNGKIEGYYVKPANVTEKTAAVLVVHENRGLNPYIKDVARRVAKAGFIALAPDGLSSIGGYPGNDADGKEMQGKIDREKLLNDFFNGFEFLYNHSETTQKIGAVGFCYGGGVCNALAVAYPELSASVPFYGSQVNAEDVPRIKSPLLLHFAELDERINKGWTAYEEALKINKKDYTAHIYKDCNHGFHNDSTPRYDEKNANLAWSRTIDFFNKNLL
jgi:carboxymethylenebutenolidase